MSIGSTYHRSIILIKSIPSSLFSSWKSKITHNPLECSKAFITFSNLSYSSCSIIFNWSIFTSRGAASCGSANTRIEILKLYFRENLIRVLCCQY
nr:MAG TPA: hypothetical protein [Bacteriophage sp.]